MEPQPGGRRKMVQTVERMWRYGDKNASWPVSRVLCRGSLRRDGHSSGTRVAARLKQPTRTAMRKRIPPRSRSHEAVPSLFGFAPGGVCLASPVTRAAVRSYHTLSPLLLPASAATSAIRGRFAFCGTFPGVAPAGRYPAPCFRGARTFLHPKSATTLRPTTRLSEQRPSGQLAM